MRSVLTLLGFCCLAVFPLAAQNALVSSVEYGPPVIGVIDTQSAAPGTFLNIATTPANSLVVSADGTHAYVSVESLVIDYVNLSTGSIEAQLSSSPGPQSLGISPDGSRLYEAVMEPDHQLGIVTIETSTNRQINRIFVAGNGADYFTAEFGFSADRKTLFVAFEGYEILALNAATGAYLSTTPLPFSPVGLASALSANVLAVSGEIGQQGVVTILNPQTLSEEFRITLPAPSCVGALALDPKGQNLYVIAASACQNGAATEILKINFAAKAVTGRAATLSPASFLWISTDGSTLYVGESSNVTLLSAGSLAQIGRYSQPGKITALAVTLDGTHVYAANTSVSETSYTAEGRILLGGGITVGPTSDRGSQSTLVTTTDGTLSFAPSPASGSIAVLNNETKTLAGYLAVSVEPSLLAVGSSSGPLFAVSVSMNGAYASKLSTLDIDSGELLKTVPLVNFAQSAMALSPNGLQLWITSRNDNQVSVYDAATLHSIGTFAVSEPQGIAFSADSQHCYIALYAVEGGILDVNTQTLLTNRTIAPSLSATVMVHVSPDGQTLYVLSNESIYAVRLSDGAILSSAFAGSKPTLSVMSTDGAEVYVADNQYLRIYDTTSGVVTDAVELQSEMGGLSFTKF